MAQQSHTKPIHDAKNACVIVKKQPTLLANYKAAAILPFYIDENGHKQYLLGLEDRTHKSIVKHRKWGDPIVDTRCLGAFGGKKEKKDDNSIFETALREFHEETGWFFGRFNNQLRHTLQTPGTPLIWQGDGGYACFIVQIDFVDPRQIPVTKEMLEYVWVSAKQLVELVDENCPHKLAEGFIFNGTKYHLFSFFLSCLKLPGVRAVLKDD